MAASKKKLLIIHESMRFGGAEKVLSTVLRNLSTADYDVTLMLKWADGEFLDSIPSDIRVIPLYPSRSLAGRILAHFPPVEYGLERARVVRALRKAGLTHFDASVSFMEGWPARCHSYVTGLADRNVSWVHCDMDAFRWHERYFPLPRARAFYSGIDAVAVVSAQAADSFRRMFPLAPVPAVIYNPHDFTSVRDMAGEGVQRMSALDLCIVGRLIPVKNQRLAIDVLARILRDGRDAALRIVGDGPEMENLRGYARACGVAERVFFTGFQQNPYKYMASADICLMTSESEGLSMTVIEAMSLGRPVVSTDITGPHELLAGGAGLLCPSDAGRISEAVGRLADDSSLRERCVRLGLDRAADFSVDKVMSRIRGFVFPDAR